MDEKEIFAEKVRAIISREKARDLYDLWFLINRGVTVDLKLLENKMSYYNEKWDYEKFKVSVDKKKNLWDLDLKPLVDNFPSYDSVKKEVLNFFKTL